MARNTTPVAYSYQRFSSPEQAKGDSLRRQTQLRDAWIQRHGVTLDDTIRDEGISGFSGKHRNDTAALGRFLRLVERGDIAKGSYLIVESLDRLSREHVQEALRLLLNLTAKGIRIVQLLPVEIVYDDKSDTTPLLMAVMELSRGHSESLMKSERVGGAWREKKRAAAEGEIVTSRMPSWLRLEGDKIVVDETKAATIRRIFKLASSGYGIGVIAKKFNTNGVAPIAKGKVWARSYVSKILLNRAVVGEYLPMTRRGGKRRPDGEPVADYYPRIISDDQWHASRAAMASRRLTGGRGSPRVNLWQAIAHDARDGARLSMMVKDQATLVNTQAVVGANGSKYISFPMHAFDEAVLGRLRELDPRDILPEHDASADKALALAGKLADIEGRITAIQANLIDGDGATGPLMDAIRKLETKRAEIAAELAAAQRAAATPVSGAWKDTHSLLEMVRKVKDDPEARTRLRGAIRKIIQSVHCVFVPRGRFRLAAVQVQFVGGNYRDYLIVHKASHANGKRRRPEMTVCNSWPTKRNVPRDFQDKRDVAAIEQILESLPIDQFLDDAEIARRARREREAEGKKKS